MSLSLTADKIVDCDSSRDDNKIDLLTCDRKVSKWNSWPVRFNGFAYKEKERKEKKRKEKKRKEKKRKEKEQEIQWI